MWRFKSSEDRFSRRPVAFSKRVVQGKQVRLTVDAAGDSPPGPAANLAARDPSSAFQCSKNDELVGAISLYRQEVRPL
jgi:hypothetical protein